LPLLETARVEVCLPDLPFSEYQNLLRSFEEEFCYAFGGCSVLRAIDGSYLSISGEVISDRINLIYSDLPVALSTDFAIVAQTLDSLKKPRLMH